MKFSNRALAALLAVLLLLLLGAYWSPSVAQDKPATIAELQTNTECGKEAIGLNRSTGMPIRYQREGLHVNAQGIWEECSMPKPPAAKPLMQDCVTPQIIEWEARDNVCRHVGAVQIPHAGRQMILTGPGPTVGGILMSCANGRLSPGFKYCSPAEECEGTLKDATDDGHRTTWSFSGRVPMGGTGIATDGRGGERPVKCEGGVLSLK